MEMLTIAQQAGGLSVAAAMLPPWTWWKIERHPWTATTVKLIVYPSKDVITFHGDEGYALRHEGESIKEQLSVQQAVKLLVEVAEEIPKPTEAAA